jgi:hypothetical protein
MSITRAWERVKGPPSDPEFPQRFAEAKRRMDEAMAYQVPGLR